MSQLFKKIQKARSCVLLSIILWTSGIVGATEFIEQLPEFHTEIDIQTESAEVITFPVAEVHEPKIERAPAVVIEVATKKTLDEKYFFAKAVFLYAQTQESDIPPELVMLVSCAESGYGTSALAVKYYNLFGIKSGKNDQKFDTIEDSIHDFYRILALPRYQHLHGATLEQWISGLAPAGYCQNSAGYDLLLHSVHRWVIKQGGLYV